MPNLAVVRNGLANIGWGKQNSWDTPVVPSTNQWWRWLDGTDAQPETGFAKEREGDTSPYIGLVYKNKEYGKITVVEYARPRTIGCALQAVLGTGSDTYSAPAFSTTIAASITAGATTLKSTADLGNIGTLAVAIGPLTTTFEVVTLDLTTRTTPNYTYTVAASGTIANAHTNADPLITKAGHLFKRAVTTYDPYTLEVQYGVSGTAPYDVEQYLNAVCTEVRITCEKGKPVKLSHTWYSTKFSRKASFTTPVTYEGTSIIGASGSPYIWWQAQNAWVLDGSSVNGRIERFELVIKNSTNAEDLLTDGLNPGYFTPGNIDIEGTAQIVWTSYDQYYRTYYGNTTSPSSTASDSPLMGVGSLTTTYTQDAINSLVIAMSNVNYTAAKKPTPKLDGMAMKQQLMFSAVRTPAVTDPLQITVNNTQNAVY